MTKKITFIKTPAENISDGGAFVAGKAYSLNEASANHWVSRGYALYGEVSAAEKKAAVAEAVAEAAQLAVTTAQEEGAEVIAKAAVNGATTDDKKAATKAQKEVDTAVANFEKATSEAEKARAAVK